MIPLAADLIETAAEAGLLFTKVSEETSLNLHLGLLIPLPAKIVPRDKDVFSSQNTPNHQPSCRELLLLKPVMGQSKDLRSSPFPLQAQRSYNVQCLPTEGPRWAVP